MSLWTGFQCAECHGAFAQGTSRGSALAGISYPYELERAKMRQTAGEIPEHAQEFMRDTVLKRLYQWLQEGADPEGGVDRQSRPQPDAPATGPRPCHRRSRHRRLRLWQKHQSIFYALHSAQLPAESVRLTYTFGLGGISVLALWSSS